MTTRKTVYEKGIETAEDLAVFLRLIKSTETSLGAIYIENSDGGDIRAHLVEETLTDGSTVQNLVFA